MTFNTKDESSCRIKYGFVDVLNLVINGWPSIQMVEKEYGKFLKDSFKPCYKWMTFNTSGLELNLLLFHY